ncbi:MAG: putative permease [Verrucomicrobiales bacterium]
MLEVVVSSIGQMAGLCALGWLIDRLGYCTNDDYQRWSKVAVDFFLPLLIFHSIVRDLDTSHFAALWTLPLLGFGLMVMGGAAGLVLKWGLSNREPDRQRTFMHVAAINNFGFLPIYIISNLIDTGQAPATLLALFFVFNLGSTIGFWTIGVITLTGGGLRDAWKRAISPPMLAICMAIPIAHLGGREWIPSMLLRTADAAGSIAVPLMLIITGAILRGAFRKEPVWDIAYTTAVRNLIIPAIAIVIGHFLPLTDDGKFLWNIVAVMPAAATTPIMARLYGGSPEFGSAVLVVSTLAGIVTVPLGILLAQWW